MKFANQKAYDDFVKKYGKDAATGGNSPMSKKLFDTPQQPSSKAPAKSQKELVADLKAKKDAERARVQAASKAALERAKAQAAAKKQAASPKPTSSGGGTRPEVPLPGKPRIVSDTPGGMPRPMPLDYGTGSEPRPGSPAAQNPLTSPRTTIDRGPIRPENVLPSRPTTSPPGGMKTGGAVGESAMMKKEGRGMAKANMQKIAGAAVKKHEKAMHGMKSGGSVSKRADGCAQRGKTKGRMV